ncbi:Zinc finger, C3HC4 type (RING finger) [Rhizoctonia solani]|uniref:Zinc finger, C3HC4 type (RING finger) n=1 Tax=Rhizoctonia solani TaxID=456999 RepID=A0A8H7LJ24_9AGAM|nr:Zinc finger, C3HC4 type (RING finger) [Rhizoctonia solani]
MPNIISWCRLLKDDSAQSDTSLFIDNSQYRVWDRTRRLQMAPFLAQAEQNNGTNPAQPPGSVAIDMSSTEPKEKESRSESLFGPPIPPDTVQDFHFQSTQPQDEVSQAVINDWVDKNKQGDEPATTLQALVNLKRPSLRLTPLASNASNTDLGSNTKASHGLEFDYDCDAAKCRITVTMASNDRAKPEPEGKEEPIAIFETVTEGGFGRTLKHEDGAILDLAQYDESKEAGAPMAEDLPTPEQIASPAEPPAAVARSRRRISVPFHIRRRDRGPQQAVGPALPVVDADAHNAAESSKDNTPKETEGVDVNIQLDALDEAGESTSPKNSQLTVLHIVKMGQPPSDGAEDTRPWVVRVVRRDALIGNHTFRLHEIYGLASANAPAPAPQTYPPAPATDHDGEALPDAHTQQQTYEFAGAECVLCLSSPREVMLLPCRHLVACKECAENMITFGAGEGVSAPAPVADEATPPANTNTNQPPNGAPNTNTTPEPLTPFQAAAAAGRRKRKAKGWFCPVCRQPYTSLLRISMQPLNVKPDGSTAPAEQVQQPTNETEQQMQSKGPLSGVVSMARGVLTRKPTTEAAPAVDSTESTAVAGQSDTPNATSATNNA